MIFMFVPPGVSLFTLSRLFGTSVEAIATASGISDPSLVFAGQIVVIPLPGEPVPAPPPCPPCPRPGGTIYIVMPGDTLFFIARKFRITIEAIVAENALPSATLIVPGMRLLIPPPAVMPPPPPPPPPPPVGFIYTVVVGDTLFLIARRFGTTIDAILAVNPQITNPDVLFPGQRIFIPVPPPAT